MDVDRISDMMRRGNLGVLAKFSGTAALNLSLLLFGCSTPDRSSNTLSPDSLSPIGESTRVTVEPSRWGTAQLTTTDLVAGDTNQGKYAYFFASVMTRAGCHVAKVEGEREVGVCVRLDGKRGTSYLDIGHPVFSSDGAALAYAARDGKDSFFVINRIEGPHFDEVLPGTFVFSRDGKRHAYVAKQRTQLVMVVDSGVQIGNMAEMLPVPQAAVFSPDGSGVGYLETCPSIKKMRAVVNGKAGETLDGIDLGGVRFSPDGRHFAYPANDRGTGNQWFFVKDGQRCEGTFDALGVSYAFSPDGKRFVYTGRRGNQWLIVEDGKPPISIEGVVDHSVMFSPDGQRLAYAVAKPDRRAYIVLDNQPGLIHDGIGGTFPPGLAPNRASMQSLFGLARPSLLFSPDSRRFAYLVHFGNKKRVFVDDKDDGIEMEFLEGGMVFSEDSKHLAYGGRAFDEMFRDKRFLVVDGKRGTDYDALGFFDFSPDGKHVAYAAKKGNSFVIVVDGKERAEHGSVPAGPIFRSDGVLEFLATDDKSLYRIEVRNL